MFGDALRAHNQAVEARYLDDLKGAGNALVARVRRDPGELAGAFQEVDPLLASAEGIVKADTSHDIEADLVARLLEAQIRGYADQGNFEAARVQLNNEALDEFLPPGLRQQLYREVDREEERADRLADKALKERQQAVSADAVSRLNDDDPSNHLTQAQLDQLLVRRDLDDALHSKLSKALNVTEPRKDDPQAVVQLYQDLEGQSDSDAFKSKALQMYADGLITKPTLDKFRSQADGSESEGQDVKQYRKFVADAVATAGPLAVLDQDTSFSKAAAIREFNERVAAGEPPKDVADDVMDRYRLLDPGPTGLPKPRFLRGDRSDLEALENARQATAAAYQEGRITKAQAVEESRLIKQLMDMAQAQAKQRQASTGQRK